MSQQKVAVAVLCWVLAACATEAFSPDMAPEYIMIRDFTPFFRLGPQQGKGPDASLPAGVRVKLLRREMGFSLVQLEDSRTGYIANENMAVAPPRPPEKVLQKTSSKKHDGQSHSEESPIYLGPQINDSPLPDLNIETEIVPDSIPASSAQPEGTPKFRY